MLTPFVPLRSVASRTALFRVLRGWLAWLVWLVWLVCPAQPRPGGATARGSGAASTAGAR